jgi:hypothetical protein
LTHDFLYLEGEIDNFASQVGTYAFSGAAAMPVLKGKHARLGEQLDVIRTKRKNCSRRPRETGLA